MQKLLSSIEFELSAVESQMNKEFGLKASGMEELVPSQMDQLDQFLLPAITLAVAKAAGPVNNTCISLGSVIQHIYLAQFIHNFVKDTDMAESSRQFPILVGDYIFGQSFVKMCDHDLFPYISDFVAVIKAINEGIILRWRLKNTKISVRDFKQIIGKEKASLTTMAARLGAQASGIKGPYISKLEKFGYHLGMAWAASEEPKYSFLVQEHLPAMKILIYELRDSFAIRSLWQIYEFLESEVRADTRLASIQ